VEEIVTGEAVILDLPCARFPVRTLAHLIDMCLQGAALLIIAIIIVVAGSGLDDAAAGAVFITAFVAVLVGYPVAFETLSRGHTPGKLALGLRVVAEDGGPVRFRQALVRGLAGLIELWLLIGIPALITSMLSARGKRLGDIFAGTFVLRERAPRAPATPYPVPVEPALVSWAASLDLSGLPDQLADTAASYLSRTGHMNVQARDRLGWQLAASIAVHVSPPPPPGLPPVTYLATVLAERRNRDLARLSAAAGPAPSVPPATLPSAAPAQAAAAAEPAPPPAGGFTPPI
jgi:uncharacterized RDD family membrane protein YckC